MKIAICGATPVGLLAADYFSKIGGSVSLFMAENPGENWGQLASHFHESPFPAAELHELLEWPKDKIPTTWQGSQKFWNEVLASLEGRIVLKYNKIQRIQKRFLTRGQHTVQGKSRLVDLFRLVYSSRPGGDIKNWAEKNPEMAKGLGEEVLNSLEQDIELIEDFDIVMDCRDFWLREQTMGAANAPALNEKNHGEEVVLAGLGLLNNWEKLLEAKRIFINGDDYWIAKSLSLLLKEVGLKEKEINLTHHELPFKWTQSGSEKSLEGILDTFEDYENVYRQECEVFEKSVYEWRNRSLHERTKIPEPKMPERRLNFFKSYLLTSMDRLIDQEGLFVTMEYPDFLEDAKEQKEFITRGVDLILTALESTPYSLQYPYLDMDKPCELPGGVIIFESEPGFFQVKQELGQQTPDQLLKEQIKCLKSIEEKLLGFFSRS